jgi:formylglycine-generating enzyme required for sulfatase activity
MTSRTTITALLACFAGSTLVAASCGGTTPSIPPPPKTTTSSVASSGGGDTVTTGTGGAGGMGGAGGSSGMGGSGGMVACSEASNCPGVNTECQTRLCAQGFCSIAYTANGVPLAAQNVGDCKVVVCDGGGKQKEIEDAEDKADDSNPCTDDTCVAGTPTSVASAVGQPCTDVPNAGKVCDGKGVCIGCLSGADCASGICQVNKCVPAGCTDLIKNGLETDTDCGGADCNTCADNKTCKVAADCTSKVCVGGTCKIPVCSDSAKNGLETDIDCGGPCPPCAPTKFCAVAADCTSKVCIGGVCQAPTCTDGIQNGTETDPDCGGTCPGCTTGQKCAVPNDCSSKLCVNNKCACPAGMRIALKVGGGTYCIDTTEVTTTAYTDFLGVGQDVQTLPAVCAYKADSPAYVPGVWPQLTSLTSPVAYVDWCDAYAYCAYAGKHLCGKIGGGQNTDPSMSLNVYADPTKSEWYNACSALGNNVYPYGNAYTNVCVSVDQTDPNAPAGTCGANTCAPVLDTANVNYAKCQGGLVGLYGMSGNLAEWENSCDDATNPSACHVRGGSHCEKASPAGANSALRCDESAVKPIKYQDCDVGFRCCY